MPIAKPRHLTFVEISKLRPTRTSLAPMAELSTKLVANDALGKLGGERDGLTAAEAQKRMEDSPADKTGSLTEVEKQKKNN